MIRVPDRRYLELPTWSKRERLLEAGARELGYIPRRLEDLETGETLVLVLYNPTFDAALAADQEELDRVWRSRDGGDARPVEAFAIKTSELRYGR